MREQKNERHITAQLTAAGKDSVSDLRAQKNERHLYRKVFSKIPNILSIPHLLEVQTKSYRDFLQAEIKHEDRELKGLHAAFKTVFPVEDGNKRSSLEYVKYKLDEPKYEEGECRLKGYTYVSPLHVTFRLIIWDVSYTVALKQIGEEKNKVIETIKEVTGLGVKGAKDLVALVSKDPEDGVQVEHYSDEEEAKDVRKRLEAAGATVEISDKKNIREIKEQEVFFDNLPIMTGNGSFIINGTERVIVNQLHRSPGVFFGKSKDSSLGKGSFFARIIPQEGSKWLDFEFDSKDLLHVRIDRKKKFHVSILLKAMGYGPRDIMNYYYPVEVIHITEEGFEKEINQETIKYQKASVDIVDKGSGDTLVRKGMRFGQGTLRKLEKAGVNVFPIDKNEITGLTTDKEKYFCAEDITDADTGEILVDFNEPITDEVIDGLKKNNVEKFKAFYIDDDTISASLRNTLLDDKDKTKTAEDAIKEIYKRFRPTDPPTLKVAKDFFENMFFNPETYRLSKVGRIKINYKLGMDLPDDHLHLSKEDIRRTIKYLLDLQGGKGSTDDIDHLGNRRVKTIGELIEDRFYHGVKRLAKSVKEKMSYQPVEDMMPNEILMPKTVTSVVKEFFNTGQLSQFMDQTNPLSEITHKRRLSALGPGGLTRERAGFEVRDVHVSHYGKICPIETPEGPNIGLISSLSTYATVNQYGFIQTPYRVVKDGVVTDEIVHLSAHEEEKFVIAQVNAPVDDKGVFKAEFISARHEGEFKMEKSERVELMDVSPNQLVSVSASLIPFLEHDDANRALMGSNMQRQAVPLIKTSSPIVGTGMESTVARDSGVTAVAKNDGIVDYVDANKIVISSSSTERSNGSVDIFNLIKFQKSNQSTCWNQKPIVSSGQMVKKGQVVADGPSTDEGELALGKNITVAFMPWGGYNFEDAILVSERLLKNDSFTSIHIEEEECMARETKLGKEEITRDIPNAGEESLRNLDEHGIIRIGATVKPGDILVGKISPKGETQLSPEEKLLKAIFGDKAGDVKDTSLKASPGTYATVIDVKVLVSRAVDKDSISKAIDTSEIAKLKQEREEDVLRLEKDARSKVNELIVGKRSASSFKLARKTILKKDEVITEDILSDVPFEKLPDINVAGSSKVENEVKAIVDSTSEHINIVKKTYERKISNLQKPDELQPGVLKIVKVYLAAKRKLQVGDKMAGRHGNKGVVSKILAQEDMPYLPDGRSVDMVLNPLGVPSRMNVGQVLEAHLGWVAKELGRQLNEYVEAEFSADSLRKKFETYYSGSAEFLKFLDSLSDSEVVELAKDLKDGIPIKVPVFDGAKESEIKELYKEADLPMDGKTILFNGHTGEPFDQKVTVGIMYMLKLHHLVEEKIHARAIGPYSLVTQQPLGGKAHFGGQRLGEMEVWALEAYGAAYTLQEFLTFKSDDVVGRTRIFDSVVKGDLNFEPGLPESFKVLQKELQSLVLNVDLIEEQTENNNGGLDNKWK